VPVPAHTGTCSTFANLFLYLSSLASGSKGGVKLVSTTGLVYVRKGGDMWWCDP
jgi:hypothetical protein